MAQEVDGSSPFYHPIFLPGIRAKKHEACQGFASCRCQAALHAPKVRFIRRQACFIKRLFRWSSFIPFRYEALFRCRSTIWSIRFAHIMRKWKNESLLPENALIRIKSPKILRCKRSVRPLCMIFSFLFLFYNLHFLLYTYILTVLSITAAANWKLFAFYGKYIRNRPSKKCLLPTPQVNCVQWDCVFFSAQSCRMLLFALVLAGSWSGPGCSAILEYSAFLLPRFSPLVHVIYWRLGFVL